MKVFLIAIIMSNFLTIKPGERSFIVGQSGSGKTVLSNLLIPQTGNVLIIDPKGELNYPDFRVISKPSELNRVGKTFKIIYKPDYSLMNNYLSYNEVYRFLFQRGNAFCYTDEVIPTLNGIKSSQFMQLCYQLGRSKKISMLSGTQRPFRIPRELMTESSKFFLFKLIDPHDLDRMQKIIGEKYTNPVRYTFRFKDLQSDKPSQLMKIQL